MPPATTVPAELLYTTASLIESFKIVPLAPQFLRDQLFPRVSETASDLVAVDFYSGSQKLAPYCSRFSERALPCHAKRLRRACSRRHSSSRSGI